MKLNKQVQFESIKSDLLLRFSTYMLMFFLAVSITMISPMLPDIIKEFKLSLSRGGLIITAQGIGGIIITIFLGLWADKYRKSSLLIIGFSLLIVSLLLISVTPLYSMILFLFFIYGIGSKIVDTLSNAFVSDLYPQKKSMYLNFLHSFFGIGALLGPIYTGFLADNGVEWQGIIRILGFLCIFVLVLFLWGVQGISGGNKDEKGNKPEQLIRLLKDRHIWVMSLIMFLYVGHQAGISTWIPMYMETYLEVSSFMAGLGLSFFWLGIIIGRLTSFLFIRYLGRNFLLREGSLIGGIVLTIGVLAEAPMILIISLGFTGLFTGALIPLLIDIASDWYPFNTGAVTSILFLSLNISLMVFPWVIGIVLEVSFRWGLLITSLILLLVSVITYVYDFDDSMKDVSFN